MALRSIAPVSNSEISLFLRCRRHWYLKYVLWLAPDGGEPPVGNMQLGSRVHLAFEAFFKSGQQYSLQYWLDQVYGAALLQFAPYAEEVRREHELARVMIDGYVDWSAEEGLDEGTEIIAAEQDVQVPMPGMAGITLRGRLDQMIRRVRDGAVLFRDWKTTGNLAVANGLEISPQMRFYTMIRRLQEQDSRVDGGQVVYLLRSKRTARAVPPFYQLEEIRYNRDTLNATYLKTRQVISEMLYARNRIERGEADHRQAAYPSPMYSCAWDCPFIAMCPLMDSGEGWRDMAKGEFTQQDPYAYYNREVPGAR
jgi:PD-(D/E)XK nuclease superfamily